MAKNNPPLHRRNPPAGLPKPVTGDRRRGQKGEGVQWPMANKGVEVHVAPQDTADPSPPEAETTKSKKKGVK